MTSFFKKAHHSSSGEADHLPRLPLTGVQITQQATAAVKTTGHCVSLADTLASGWTDGGEVARHHGAFEGLRLRLTRILTETDLFVKEYDLSNLPTNSCSPNPPESTCRNQSFKGHKSHKNKQTGKNLVHLRCENTSLALRPVFNCCHPTPPFLFKTPKYQSQVGPHSTK